MVPDVSSVSVMGPNGSKGCLTKCRPCFSLFKWVPVIFISLVLSWGYYAYVIQLCIFTISNVILQCVCLGVFHFLYIMTFWSYWKTICTKAGVVPLQFWFTKFEFELLRQEDTDRDKVIQEIVNQRELPILCRTSTGRFRLCEKCNLIKPDRTHHCSICGLCILKMDHHCPWVNNCVSFTNYKFFVLFLGYAFMLCAFSASTSCYYFIRSWTNETPSIGKFHILFLFFVSVMFGISLISLFSYHLYLVFVNRSTLESFRSPIFIFGPDKFAFNLGKYENWCQIFGSSKLKWFLPVSTSLGDGISFKTNSAAQMDIERGNQISAANIGKCNSREQVCLHHPAQDLSHENRMSDTCDMQAMLNPTQSERMIVRMDHTSNVNETRALFRDSTPGDNYFQGFPV